MLVYIIINIIIIIIIIILYYGIPLIGISGFEGRIKSIGLHWIFRVLHPRISMKPDTFNCTKRLSWEYKYARYAVRYDLTLYLL